MSFTMSLNQKQHQYLDAMGINLWQRKPLAQSLISTAQLQSVNDETTSLDLTVLSQSQLFNDIIQSIDISLGDISIEKNTLNLGWLSWEINKGNTIYLSDNILRTPEISTLSTSNSQKAELWALLAQQA